MQTMIHQHLVWSEALVEVSSVSVRCIHGDVHEYPLVPIEIRCGGRSSIWGTTWGVAKTAAVAASPLPRTKKEVRWFLGLAGYYRQFVPHFLDLASPLTDLTRKRAPDTVQWSEPCQVSFEAIKTALGPVCS